MGTGGFFSDSVRMFVMCVLAATRMSIIPNWASTEITIFPPYLHAIWRRQSSNIAMLVAMFCPNPFNITGFPGTIVDPNSRAMHDVTRPDCSTWCSCLALTHC